MSDKDPRLSVEERYPGFDDYLQRIRSAAMELIRGRFLLQEDLDHVRARAKSHWDLRLEGALPPSHFANDRRAGRHRASAAILGEACK
jgi:hypothetical protein